MENTEPLAWYGLAVILVSAGFILIPYLRGKSDLLTSWNFLLTGVALYVGIGCFEVVFGFFEWQQLQWFQPTRSDVAWFMLAGTAFYAALLVCYYWNPIASSVTSRILQKWPDPTGMFMICLLALCTTIVIANLFVEKTGFFGLALHQLAHKALIFATVFSFMNWYKNKFNIVLLFMFLLIYGASGFYAMLVFSGRRLLLSVLIGPIFCLYWLKWRSRPPMRNVAILTVAAAVLFMVGLAYSTFRFYSKGAQAEERSASTLVERMKTLSWNSMVETISGRELRYLTQNTVHYSLLMSQLVRTGYVQPEILNTLSVIVTYPVPREAWNEKPRIIGKRFPHDILHIPGNTSWGIGIVGHGAFEGGIPALALYAFLVAVLVRVLDDPLARQPHNPFLISVLAAAGPHIVAWPRGEISIMAIETLECLVLAVLLGMVGRLFFGTAPVNSQASPSR